MAWSDRSRKRERGVEFVLTVAALGVLLPALALVFLARWSMQAPAEPTLGRPLLINEATAEQFALALKIDIDLADRLVAARNRLGGFDSVNSLLYVHLFDRTEAERLAQTLSVSHLDPRTATARQFAAVLGLSSAVAARLAGYRDAGIRVFRSSGVQEKQTHTLANKLQPKGESHTSESEYLNTRIPEHLTPMGLLERATVLDPQATGPLLSHLLARRPATVFWHYAISCGLIALTIFLLPAWLRNRARVSGDPFLLPLALLLSGLGVVMLFSGKDPLRDSVSYEHHLRGIAMGLVAFVLCARLAPSARLRLKNYQYTWVLGSALLVLLLVVFGHGPEGVKLDLFGFQPVEIIKLMLVFFLAGYLSSRADLIADTTRREQGRDGREEGRGKREESNQNPKSKIQNRRRLTPALPRREDIGPVAVLYALSLLLFYVIKDLGPGLLLFATFIAILYLTTGRSGFVGVGIVLLIVGAFLGYWRHIGVFGTRVDMWLSPFANSHPTGMQLGQGYWALSSGGWTGSGLGLGMPNLIPRGQDDLAFISWSEETGLIGAWFVLLIYVALIWRGVRIALRAGNDFDRVLAFGLTALLGLQTLLILGGVTGLIPLTGISLPFLCYGDSALVADFVIIGLLRGISVPPGGGVGRPEARLEVTRAAQRFAVALTLLLVGVIGLYRLWPVQVWNADAIAARPIVTPDADGVLRPHQNPRLLAVSAEIERGSLYDRSGRVLATSRPKEILHLVSDPNRAQRLIATHARLYPYGPAFADLVGYLDPAIGGPSGFERAFNVQLRGYDRLKDLLADYRSRHMPGYTPRRGRDLHLTLDAPLQQAAMEALQQATSRLKDERNGKPKDRAAFVLLNPQTGDVIVAATIPTFDPNTLTPEQYHHLLTADDPELEHPFIDRAVYGYYPPGSTLKVATAACALDNLPNALSFTATCDRIGTVRWQAHGVTYSRVIHDDKGDPAFGPLTLPAGFRVSSNIYFANLAVAIGADTFRATLADKMGFRYTPKQPGFDADLADLGYGQGRMLASPLEMARLAASVANEGKMMQPRYISSITDPAGLEQKRVLPPVVRSQAMTPQTAATLRDLMRSVVTSGTAQGVFDSLPVHLAGKTGTAQNHQLDQQPHSWFIGFAPTADRTEPNTAPRYAFACLVENGGYGRQVAAVVCRNFLRKLF